MEYSRVPWGIFLPLEFVFSPCGTQVLQGLHAVGCLGARSEPGIVVHLLVE